MIVHLTGPSGSGKSVAAMKIMARYDGYANMYVASVKNPNGVGVYCTGEGQRPLALIGRYSGHTCGGLDTLRRNFGLAHDLCEHLHDEGYSVLSEGFITDKQTFWLERLAVSRPVVVLCLRVSLDEAVTGVAARRAKRIGEMREGSREYCEYQIRSCERTMRKLESSQTLLKVEWTSRATIDKRLTELLGVDRKSVV